MRAGRIGTKMSAIILMKREKRLPLLAASCLASSLETSLTPDLTISSKTMSTSPGPTMIWNMPPATNVPFRSGSLSSAFWSTWSRSARTRRRRVAQCAAAVMLSEPPT